MDLFDQLKLNKAIPPFSSGKGNFVVDDFVGISLLTSTTYKTTNKKQLIIAPNLYKAQNIYNLLNNLLPKARILLFPSDELIRAEIYTQSKEMIANRIYVLNELIEDSVDILICNVASFTRYLPNPELFKQKCLKLKVNQKYNIQELKKTLISSGYTLVNKIDQSLEYAVRGDIIDVFSVNHDNPVRIEFFDDEIESIRFFDISSQSSIEKVNEVIILPGHEFLLSENEYNNATEKIFKQLEKDEKQLSKNTFDELRDNVTNTIAEIMEYSFSPKLYRYFSFLQDKTFALSDYLNNFNVILVDKDASLSSNDLLLEESSSYLYELFESGKEISHLQLNEDIRKVLTYQKNLITTFSLRSNNEQLLFNAKQVPFVANRTLDAINVIHTYLNDDYKIVIALSSKEHLNLLIESLEDSKIKYSMVNDLSLPSKGVGISIYPLVKGFVLEDEKIVYLTSNELFSEKIKVARFNNRFKEATILKGYEDLKPGDYVVHEYQGIGQFVELQTLEVDGAHRDYLKIVYAGNEFLYVPLTQFQLVRKFQGKEGCSPKLSRLHSKDWENTKARIKQRIQDLAERLFNLYKERAQAKGFAFQKDDELQAQFENSFEHELTRDQKASLEDIKKDMESATPMDRLLCGDVGFGKTEVAFRAIFKAILSGKQAAMLCPTTLLARQHYERALERFTPFDVKIAVFSRLISEKRQKQYIQEIKEGKIHLVIGTHRLLSKDIEFKDLGLLVIDEEQRFGVEQKERLKEMKNNIDVLTLSATPIPRTLQISLLGVRNLSQINTPPEERMPIQTYVLPYKLDIVKELIERELGRNGQVFYVHNNVDDIYIVSNKIQRQVPDAIIGVAHGQMNKDDIEDVMEKFYSGQIQVLVCTSIVENGIDIPNANMIIVEDSERYGLSQLYQIKGRVGRSNRIAYAYLMYNGGKQLTENTQKRLKALQEFTQLGSGYKIAQRDLMIRGAGDILGPEQAGFIDSIGLDMYIKLLNEAAKEKVSGESNSAAEYDLNISLSVDAYIPQSFANDSEKIELYQEILSASSIESLAEVKLKTRDVFGKFPKEVEYLFSKRNIDLYIKDGTAKNLKEYSNRVEILLSDDFLNIKGIGNLIFEAMIPYISFVKISYTNHTFKVVVSKRNTWLKDLEDILSSLNKILKTNKVINKDEN